MRTNGFVLVEWSDKRDLTSWVFSFIRQESPMAGNFTFYLKMISFLLSC